MSSPTEVALRVLQLTSTDSSPEAKALRRRASLRLKEAVLANPEEGKKVLAAMKLQGAANFTAIKRAMIKAKVAMGTYLQKETEMAWGVPKDARELGYALEYGFYNHEGKNVTKVDLNIRWSEKSRGDETKVEVRAHASQGYSSTRTLAITQFIELDLTELKTPSKIFTSAFISDLKKALSGSFESDATMAMEYLDRGLENAKKAGKLLEGAKKKLSSLKNPQPADLIEVAAIHWDVKREGRSIEGVGGVLEDLEKRMKNYV